METNQHLIEQPIDQRKNQIKEEIKNILREMKMETQQYSTNE